MDSHREPSLHELQQHVQTWADSDSNSNEYCFANEFFGEVLAVTILAGNNAEEFLRNAAAFSNIKCKESSAAQSSRILGRCGH